MKGLLKRLGGFLLWVVIIVIIAFVIAMISKGIPWFSENVMPVILTISTWLLPICLFIFLPLALIKKIRYYIGNILFISSYMFGLTLWLSSFIFTYYMWGMTAVILGVIIFGVGIIPMALLASIFNGDWASAIQLIVMIVVLYGSRYIGILFAGGDEELYYDDNFTEDDVPRPQTMSNEDHIPRL